MLEMSSWKSIVCVLRLNEVRFAKMNDLKISQLYECNVLSMLLIPFILHWDISLFMLTKTGRHDDR